jgi:proliferating cell nuclear antigen PCNA
VVKLTFKNANELKDLIGLVSCINDEVRFNFNENGFLIRVMDPGRVAMVSLEVNKATLEEFNLNGETNAEMTISLHSLEKLLKGMSKNPVSLQIESNKLHIEQEKPYNRKFNMPILEPAPDQPTPEPKIDYKNTIKMTVNGLRAFIEDATLVSDHVKFIATTDSLAVQIKGDILDYDGTLKHPSDELLNLEIGEPDATAIFSLKYLDDITKAASRVASIVTVQMAKDMPIKLTFETPPETKLWYALAPRIEPE